MGRTYNKNLTDINGSKHDHAISQNTRASITLNYVGVATIGE